MKLTQSWVRLSWVRTVWIWNSRENGERVVGVSSFHQPHALTEQYDKMAPVILPSPRPGLRHTRQASYDTARHTRQASYSRSSCARNRYWATSAAPLGRVRGEAPITSDDDGSQPEQGKEAEAAGPKLEQAESQRNKKLSRDGEARNLTQEERKMTASMRQIEEIEQNGKAVKAGPGSIQFEGRHENEKVGEKGWFRDACDAGGKSAGPVAWESASSTFIGRAVRNAGRRQTSPCMED